MPSPVTDTIINLIDSGTVPLVDLVDIETAISMKRAKEAFPTNLPIPTTSRVGGGFNMGDKVRLIQVSPKYLKGMTGILVPMPMYPRSGSQRLAMFIEQAEINRFGGQNKIGKFLRPMANGNGSYIAVTPTMIEVIP